MSSNEDEVELLRVVLKGNGSFVFCLKYKFLSLFLYKIFKN